MVISLLHPSRGRPNKAFETAKEWIEKAGVPDVEYVLCTDNDDPHANTYHQLPFPSLGYHVFYYNKSVVEATNAAAKWSRGDILVYLSDDFKAPDNWGKLILKEFEGATGPRLIKIDDCLQKFDVPVLTCPIMNRALYERLGYFFHPDFKSMFCDEHLYWVAKKLGALKMCPHLKFPHEHVSIGKAPMDETYRRSSANWEQGKASFARHKAAGFPV
jgi:glycosyltransferase involved in cell wall biosynthesis